MKIAVTGASGVVGRFITRASLLAGHEVTTLGRAPLASDRPGLQFRSWTLGETPDLTGHDALIHAAFRHIPGRFRGGEGDDPDGFRRDNVDGSLRLAEAAAGGGVGRMLFLSSRAVFDGYPAGTSLTEDLPVAPDTLYGEVKAAVEDALSAMNSPSFRTVSLRATGVYGQPPGGAPHKWSDLFAAFLRGEAVAPRIATEVHGDDLARAALNLLSALASQVDNPAASTRPGHDGPDPRRLPPAVHVSDLILDHRDLLMRLAARAGRPTPSNLPERSDPSNVSVLNCETLLRLGWSGGGLDRLDRTITDIVSGGRADF